MRERIESALGRWGLFVATHPIRVIGFILLATALLATQLQHFRLDTSSEGYYHSSDPVRIQYNAFREVFGRDAVILVTLEPAGGVFEADFLEELRTLHEEIEENVPMLVEVTSLLNIRETVGTEEGLEVGDFFEEWPETEAQRRAAEARARANPLYQNSILSEDGRITSIVLETEAYSTTEDVGALSGFEEYVDADDPNADTRIPITGAEDLEIVEALEAILDQHRRPGLTIHYAGSPAFSSVLSRHMAQDMAKFMALSIAAVAFFLAVLFRRFAAVVLPLITIILSIVSTLSVMGATGTPMMPPTQVIPSFLLAVGVGGAVHLLAIFYQATRRGEDKPTAIAHSIAHSGLPIIMTSLTTAGGLLSFIPAALRPISHFGFITPIGVLLSLIFVLSLLPALIAVFPMRAAEASAEDSASQRMLVSIGHFSTRRPGIVLTAWALLVAVSCIGLTRVTIGHAMVEWFPEDAAIRQASYYLNDRFGGSVSYELLISTGEENGLHEPETLRRLEAVQNMLEDVHTDEVAAGKILSIVDVVKETHRALNENRPEYYAIPDDRRLISQELLLFENSGSDDVEDLVTAQFDTARMTVRAPFVDGAFYNPYLDTVMPQVRELLGPDLDVELTGGMRMFGNTVAAALATMVRSYSTALVVVTVLMIVLVGGFRLGLLSMIPNLAPVLFAIGLMGWVGMPLDMFSLMIGTIIIGLAVDDTIHFMHNFRREYEQSQDVTLAVSQTLRGTGQALFFTSCVLATGFLVYTQAYMVNLFDFGLLTASAILVAFLADLTLAPALVAVAMPRLARAS